ncbi:hypothetical protein ABZX93_17505 [Streptomyces sp. NPDC006632]|uniref:hypothetical protein n=1 Tax=unclassified Streptomyces TaxID=2593676 RepID=UPI002E24E99D
MMQRSPKTSIKRRAAVVVTSICAGVLLGTASYSAVAVDHHRPVTVQADGVSGGGRTSDPQEWNSTGG